jgi:ABC-type Fe3+/spermidine/putrescine transport system ATPase subunit
MGGELQQFSDPWTLYHEPVNRSVADFVGHANFLPVEMHGQAGANGKAQASLLGQQVSCLVPGGKLPGTDLVLMIRPEWLELLPDDESGAADAHGGLRLGGPVRARDFLGSVLRVWLDVPALPEPVVVDLAAAASPRAGIGELLTLRLPPDAGVILAA